MKKKITKLTLNRETLRLSAVTGSRPIYSHPVTQCYPSSPPATCPPA